MPVAWGAGAAAALDSRVSQAEVAGRDFAAAAGVAQRTAGRFVATGRLATGRAAVAAGLLFTVGAVAARTRARATAATSGCLSLR